LSDKKVLSSNQQSTHLAQFHTARRSLQLTALLCYCTK